MPLSDSPVQKRVHNVIRALGGYWPPLAATARLLEECGELGQLLKEGQFGPKISEELADIFIISTCIANQYCAHIDLPQIGNSVTNENQDLAVEALRIFPEIVCCTSEIARTINAYEGFKKPKEGEKLVSVEEACSLLHKKLAEFAHMIGTNLSESVSSKLDHASVRDRNRFSTLQDPVTSGALGRFEHIQNQTECIFARNSKIWGSPEWNDSLTLEQNVEFIIPSLLRFLRAARYEILDGFVFEAPSLVYGCSIPALATTTYRVLRTLCDRDPSGRRSLDEDLDDSRWYFSFAGERIFVITLAPCYPPTNSRYSFGSPSTFLLFQPQTSFEHVLNSERARNANISSKIREKYANVGRKYDVESLGEAGSNEAYRFVKPLIVGQPFVRWWDRSMHTV